MTLLEILCPQSPPEPKGARVVSFDTEPTTNPEYLRKGRERWKKYKDRRNAVRKARGWK
jgi:hypothetical protein